MNALDRFVPPGSVTTYAEVSRWGCGNPNLNQPVRSLAGARNRGCLRATDRVAGADGEHRDVPDGSDGQRRRILAEGVPFTPDVKVDLRPIPPVKQE